MEAIIPYIPFIAIFALMYFLLIKPQNDERKAHELLVASLTRDDKVVTTGGVHGKIVGVSDATVVLEISDKTKITLDKTFVARRLEESSSKG